MILYGSVVISVYILHISYGSYFYLLHVFCCSDFCYCSWNLFFLSFFFFFHSKMNPWSDRISTTPFSCETLWFFGSMTAFDSHLHYPNLKEDGNRGLPSKESLYLAFVLLSVATAQA